MRALIVDDALFNRILLKKMVSAYFEIDMAENGKEAVEAFNIANSSGQPYNVIFLDIMMPVMNGKEALLEIRKAESVQRRTPGEETKIIMVTAMDSPQDVVDAYFKYGCSSYMVKPVDKIKLINELKKLGIA